MREHQIVITLKPDQFLEVQRLARAANAKSMGIFVRQQLLAALGIETTGAAACASKQIQGESLQAALGQIKRLHGELKTFVAESLSLYNVGLPHTGIEPSAAVPQAQGTDPLEAVAERTFAISPRLGPIGQPAVDQARRSGSRSAAAPKSDEAAVARHDAQRRDQHRLHHAHMTAAGEILDVPYKADAQAPPLDDPLHKLLPAGEEFSPALPASGFDQLDDWSESMQQAQYEMVDDEPQHIGGGAAADVPPSLAQRLAGAFYAADEEPASSTSDPGSAVQFVPQADVEEAAAVEPAAEPEVVADPPAKPEGKTRRVPPVGQPSLSGSPPPKRRQL